MPIICSIVYLLVGILMFYIWPVLGGIYMLGDIVQRSGYYGTFLYGVIERALDSPFGLHHVFIFRSSRRQLAVRWKLRESVCREHRISSLLSLRINTVRFSVEATRFMSGKFR